MACFDSCGRNPKLVKELVGRLPVGHTNLQDKCEVGDLCPFSYVCDDVARTKVRAYGNCSEQAYKDEISLNRGVTGRVTCYLHASTTPCLGDIRRPKRQHPQMSSDKVALSTAQQPKAEGVVLGQHSCQRWPL